MFLCTLWMAPSTLVGPIAGDATFQSPHPELQNPENYYTCRYDFVPQATLDALGSPGQHQGL
jgi:hypothetical protein